MYEDLYNVIYLPKHHKANMYGFVREHILIAEEILGRKLTTSECVHHIDKNKKNNDKTNLMIFVSSSDHAAFHKGCKAIKNSDGVWMCVDKLKDIFYTCPVCEKEYHPTYKSQKNCSDECRVVSQRKCNRPDKDTLKTLIFNYSFVSISKIYNMSDNGIRRWCKDYDLPYTKEEIKKFKERMS